MTNLRLKIEEMRQLKEMQSRLCRLGQAETKSEIAHLAIKDGLRIRLRKVQRMLDKLAAK